MALIVQKFGGSSVKDRNRIFNVARIVANTHKAGNDVVVVVSAQGDTTDDLIAKAAEITHNPSAREMDMLLAAKAGAGTLVPITGFANAVVSAAIEFKVEGRVLGTGAKMFTIAGPVIVYGTLAAVVYGVFLWLTGGAA